MNLKEFVEGSRGCPVVWGTDDCSAWAAQWFRKRTGARIALPAYASMEEAHKLIDAAGGLVVLWRRCLSRDGIHEAHEPEPEGVAVLRTADHGDVGVIFGHGGIAFVRTDNGVSAIRPGHGTILAAWNP